MVSGVADESRRGAGSKIMNEDEEDFSQHQTLADIASRLIENEIYKENLAKLALILVGVLDTAQVDIEEDSETVIDFKLELLNQIVHELLYHEAVSVDEEVQKFSDWLNDSTTLDTETTPEEEY